MKAIYMLMHQKKPNTQAIVRKCVAAFHSVGIFVYAEPWLYQLMANESPELFCGDSPQECEAIVAFGGDGTFLRANTVAFSCRLPVLGINVGRLGFLTEVELEQLDVACKNLAENRFYIEKRMMLSVTVGEQTTYALNDVVVSRGGYSRLIGMDAMVDGDLIGRFIADGLIVSTPTGSTGYSLSAGGPIVCPEVECMILTPICAHSLQHRPVVASSKQTITIRLDGEHTAVVAADGQEVLSLNDKESLVITRSEREAQFIRFEPKSFFSKIRVKLAEWSC